MVNRDKVVVFIIVLPLLIWYRSKVCIWDSLIETEVLVYGRFFCHDNMPPLAEEKGDISFFGVYSYAI